MRVRVTALVAIALALPALALPAAADARETPTLIGPKGNEIRGKWHRWLKQSRMPLVPGRIRLIFGPCPGVPTFSGCVFTRRPRRLYIRRDARSLKAVLYHELGHTFDLVLLRRRDRLVFRRIVHTPKRGWFEGAQPPSEMFAEAYALCARFGPKRPAANLLGWTHSVYGYQPTRRQHAAVCKLVRKAGGERRRQRSPRPQPPPNAPDRIERQPPQPPPPREEQPSPDPVPGLPGIPGLPDPFPRLPGIAGKGPGE
jgi:hypothetical protein